MTDGEPPFLVADEPLLGFEVAVIVDRAVYAPGDTVRITVTATNDGARWTEHHYPAWQRYQLSIRDSHHRVVADDDIARPTEAPAVDRWLPGQMMILPTYWHQTEGPVVPAWADEPPGPRCAPGRYRVRVTWLGREPGSRATVPDAWSRWFELV